MFPRVPCSIESCANSALDGHEMCYRHVPNLQDSTSSLIHRLTTEAAITNASFEGVTISGLNLTGKRYVSCSFSIATLSNLHFEECSFTLCFFDHATLDHCSFKACEFHACVFAGIRSHGLLIGESNVIQTNWNGALITAGRFEDSDLYDSRFIAARLQDTLFRDCNLKRTNFSYSERRNLQFKLCNEEDAVFDVLYPWMSPPPELED